MEELKLAYTAPNSLIVNNIRNLLETGGVVCVMRNEYLGGGAGELPLNEIWPEIWVAARDLVRAETIIREASEGDSAGEWRCPACGELNGGGFELCWRCGRERAD